MDLSPFEKEIFELRDRLFAAYQKVVEENKKLKQEIAYLRAQLEEKEARLMEARCGNK